MKCDELKVHKAYNRWIDEEMPTPNDDLICNEVYLKSDVDATIDELKTENESLLQQNRELCLALQVMYSKEEYDKQKAENAELKQKLEDAKATAYAESADAGMENRRLKRALWLARAERASDKARIFYFAETCGVTLNIDGFSNQERGRKRMSNAKWWKLTWLNVERKCRAKAEEYL